MAYTQFPHLQYYMILSTDEKTPVGYFNIDDGTELRHIMFDFVYRGISATPFNIRCNIYSSSTMETALMTSDWATISATTLDSTVGHNRVGFFYVDFNGEPLNPNINYYFDVQTSGYTKDGDDSYFGINLDWYSPVNTQLTPGLVGARIRILGNR